MVEYRVSVDDSECEHLWRQVWPENCLFDLWPVRHCFAEAYDSTPYFIVAEDQYRILGLLALSKIADNDCYGFYPAETWQQKTWIEQNRIPAATPEVLRGLLEAVPEKTHLRYISTSMTSTIDFPLMVDEVNYQFFPGRVNYSFETYMQLFSGKSRKQILKETDSLKALGASYQFDNFADIDYLFQVNQASYGESSYFADSRFLNAFTLLSAWLRDNGMLKITTLRLGGKIAAVDLGALWNNKYTLLAGCTDPEFPGVAKLINLHHMETACHRKMASVDFLCGDFNWKRRFRLTESPLYQMNVMPSRYGQYLLNQPHVKSAASGY
ncbi:MAG: GNAT family N-acetyltransferase [Desulfocapsaceae bacterium]|jgi:hypothetical protein|nr:GNAT family N-acetyltransferase [Desulfocapsaceae bacterium]